MPLKLSECMWRRHFLSGFPTPLILLSFSSNWQWAMATSDKCHQRSRAEYPDCPVPNLISSKLDSMWPFVGSAPPSAAQMGQAEEMGGGWLHSQGAHFMTKGKVPQKHPAKDGTGNSPPSSPEREGADSDGSWRVMHRAPITAGEGGEAINGWHQCIWICQFLNQLTQTWMSYMSCDDAAASPLVNR